MIDARIWSHDEGKYISYSEANHSVVECKHCGRVTVKYIKSWYSGGRECVLLSKYCPRCWLDLEE